MWQDDAHCFAHPGIDGGVAQVEICRCISIDGRVRNTKNSHNYKNATIVRFIIVAASCHKFSPCKHLEKYWTNNKWNNKIWNELQFIYWFIIHWMGGILICFHGLWIIWKGSNFLVCNFFRQRESWKIKWCSHYIKHVGKVNNLSI